VYLEVESIGLDDTVNIMSEDVINAGICALTCSDLRGPQRVYARQGMRARNTSKTYEVNRKNKATKVLFLNCIEYAVLLEHPEM
jgi:hypothetical protein